MLFLASFTFSQSDTFRIKTINFKTNNDITISCANQIELIQTDSIVYHSNLGLRSEPKLNISFTNHPDSFIIEQRVAYRASYHISEGEGYIFYKDLENDTIHNTYSEWELVQKNDNKIDLKCFDKFPDAAFPRDTNQTIEIRNEIIQTLVRFDNERWNPEWLDKRKFPFLMFNKEIRITSHNDKSSSIIILSFQTIFRGC
jgi:hypothetical protein